MLAATNGQDDDLLSEYAEIDRVGKSPQDRSTRLAVDTRVHERVGDDAIDCVHQRCSETLFQVHPADIRTQSRVSTASTSAWGGS